jgi:hypothetical protein
MNYMNYWGAGMFPSQQLWFLVPLVIWSLIWKGWALWKAAKAGSKPWFVVLLIVNTVGILEILYIFVFGKEKKTRSLPPESSPTV